MRLRLLSLQVTSGMETLTVDRLELLRFMNSGVKEADGHHTAMTAFIGEPLAVGLVLHYLRAQGKDARFVSWKVTPGTKSGRRLDAWIFDGERALYQTEIKMWAGNALGGLRLKDGLTAEELSQLGRKQWLERIWDEAQQTFHAPQVSKVLGQMKRPAGFEDAAVEPLLALWWLVQPRPEDESWFTRPVQPSEDCVFNEVHVFSLTRYLLSLTSETLELELPLLPERLDWLGRLFPAFGPPQS